LKASEWCRILLAILIAVAWTIGGRVTPATINAQENDSWNHKKCAVSLTYDDGLNVHLDNVIPLLDSLGLKATFYISGSSPAFQSRLADWKAAAGKGHELGNHTLFHPCNGKVPGREWVNKDYDLSVYSVPRMLDEIRTANALLQAVDGKTIRTFAYPCGDMKAGDSSYVDRIKEEFVAARGVQGRIQKIEGLDLYDVGACPINGQSGDELIGMVKPALESHSLIVFLFHGVGGEHSLNVSLDAHNKLVHFLKQNEKEIWTAPLVEIAEHIKALQPRKD